MCPCGDIEVARENIVDWNRFVTKGCHPELSLDSATSPWDALSSHCCLEIRNTGLAICQGLWCELWDVQ